MTHLNFSWTPGDTRTDGTPIHGDLTYNLYENTQKIVSDIAAPSFSLLMDGKDQGLYVYQVSEVEAVTSLESAPSVPVSVNFVTPNAPTGLLYTITE